MKYENRDPSHPPELTQVSFNFRNISTGKRMVRKEIRLCITAVFQDSGKTG